MVILSKGKIHYWCKSCKIPLLDQTCLNCGNQGKQISNDIKPVFRKEYQYYLESAEGLESVNSKMFPKILYRHRNYLISDASYGENHYQIIVDNNPPGKKSDDTGNSNQVSFQSAGKFYILLKNIKDEKRSHGIRNFYLNDEHYMKKLISGNLKYLENIEQEAVGFIQDIAKDYSQYYKICSFSGGKDSTVTAKLVKTALGDHIPIVYSNTGIEYPETPQYVDKYGNQFGKLLHLPSQIDFMYMCDQLGPPSRTMRWCCFTNKGAPFARYYAEMEHKHVLSFDGIRAQESQSRARFSRDRDNTKYQKQYSAYPILDWTTLEVWLYIFWKKLPYNNLYEHGFARVGCWACPNNTKLDWFFFSKAHPNQVKSWFTFLDNYRKQQNEKRDDGENYDVSWLEDGYWKQRRVKYQNTDNLVSISRAMKQDDVGYGMIIPSIEYDLELKFALNKSIIDFFTVFGNPKKLSNHHYMVKNNDLEIRFALEDTELKIKIFSIQKERKLKKLVVRQINKSFNCVNCGGCVGSCSFGAISIKPDLHIDPDKCQNCLVCTSTKYLEMSCIGIHYKEERKYIKLNEL